MISKFVFLLTLASLSACPKIFHKSDRPPPLRELYFSLRKTSCKYTAEDFGNYSQMALIAGRVAEAYWAAQQAQKKAPKKEKWTLLAGHALIKMNRIEEAIIMLHPIAIKGDNQKAHLLLIKAYQKKFGITDSNVKYLKNLFFSRYPKSKYKKLLQSPV